MQPLTLARRSARWLAAAGIAFASLTASANALELADPELELDEPATIEPHPGEIRPFFEKIGTQRDCNYVTYTLRFGLRGSPGAFADPGIVALLPTLRLDFSDQMPNGLTVTNVTATGDGTMSGGGALAPSIGTSADPNDTAKLDDFRLSLTDLDGSGEPGARYVVIRITAKIDPGAFPAPTMVDNQGWVRATRTGGSTVDIPSHDPSLPDDADFRSGEKTRILVDLTGCEPPPPPPGGGEPCFEVVTGEIDCVPGGGAFIYSMPFGADMAGRVVQLKTTTPGIAIDPASQFVPAGGGVLGWTITGASPGDVIHLIVVGVEIYAGPAEGVGICCTQTIDLVIPADLDCPDEEREPDLQVEKIADVPFCTKEGGCDFTIRVTNVGDGPYNGKIVLDEVTSPGSATVSSGPNAPWTCLPGASPMSCEHPATTLNPGEFVELKIGFTPGAAWHAGAIRNCAEYDYVASGKEPFGVSTNDKACASIPLCIPGAAVECTPDDGNEPAVDLTIRKIASPVMCTEDGVCTWQIAIINPTTETFTGPLTVIDEFVTHVPISVNIEPTGPWACAPESGTRFRCDHPGLVLVGGAVTVLTVQAVVPDAPRNVENCGEIVPFPGELDTTNNQSCAVAYLPDPTPGKPVLQIAKTCEGAVAGAAISCRISVTNTGDASPSGPVRVNDAATLIGDGNVVPIQTVTPDGPGWFCSGPGETLQCQIDGMLMTPGTTRYFDVTLNVSPNERFENCARGSFGPAPGDDIVYSFGEACDQGGATISVEKTGDVQCTVGQPCTFEITVKNEGDTGFNGNVRIGDAMQVDGFGRLEGVAISEITPAFGCSPEPATLPLSCEASVSLGAGESRVHQVTVVIPDDGRFDAMTGPVGGQNCVAVLSPDAPVAGRKADATARVLEIDPDGLGGAYACHSFQLMKQEVTKQCSPGFVLNAAGLCACPEGQTFRNGKCVDQGNTPTPRPQADPKPQCKLLPGMIRTKNGNCVCTKGTELKNGACRKIVTEEPPPTRQCKLLPGQVRTKDGQCVCRKGTRLVNGVCRAPEVQCKKGEVKRNGKCVKVQIRCPKGFEGTPPNCRQITKRTPTLNITPDLLRKLIPPTRQTEPKRQ